MVFGYIRISKVDQSAEGQKSLIARYVVERKIIVDEWIEVEMSSRKSVEKLSLIHISEPTRPY